MVVKSLGWVANGVEDGARLCPVWRGEAAGESMKEPWPDNGRVSVKGVDGSPSIVVPWVAGGASASSTSISEGKVFMTLRKARWIRRFLLRVKRM